MSSILLMRQLCSMNKNRVLSEHARTIMKKESSKVINLASNDHRPVPVFWHIDEEGTGMNTSIHKNADSDNVQRFVFFTNNSLHPQQKLFMKKKMTGAPRANDENAMVSNNKNGLLKHLLFIVLIGITVICPRLSWGQVITEDFNYTAASTVLSNGWTNISASGSNAILVTSPGLTYPGYVGSGVGNAVSLTTMGEDDGKGFTAITSGSIYYSAMISVSAAQATGDYFLALNGSAFSGRLYAKSSGTGFVLGASKTSEAAPTYDASIRAFNTTFLVVIRYTFNTGTNIDDVVALWINPTIGGIEPAATIAGITAATADASTLGTIALRQGAAAFSATVRVDGIKVGTTWASVALAARCPASTAATPVVDQTVCVGVSTASQLTATITTGGTSGNPVFAYQWYYNTTNSNIVSGATPLPGGSSQTYTPSSGAADAGTTRYYFCVGYATDNGCAQTAATQSLASNTVKVTVNSIVCQNGGTVNTSCGCDCPQGYTGTNCQTAACTAGTWLGTTSSSWTDPSNWCGGVVPTPATSVIIPSVGTGFTPVIITDVSVTSITIAGGGRLEVQGSHVLSLSGDMTISSGGTFVSGTCVLKFAGSGSSVLSCANPSLSLYDLQVSHALQMSSPACALTCNDLSILSGSSCTLQCASLTCRDVSLSSGSTCTPTCSFVWMRDCSIPPTPVTHFDLSACSVLTCSGSITGGGTFSAPALTKFTCASGTCTVSGGMTGTSRLKDVSVECASSSSVISVSGDIDMDNLTLTQGKLVSPTCTPATCASFKCHDLSISSLAECDLSSLPECTLTGSLSNAGALRPPLLVRVTCTDGSCTLSGDLAGTSKLHSLQVDCALQATDVQVACAMQLDDDLHLDKGGLSFSTCTPATCPYLECRDLTVAATARVLGTGGKLPKLTSIGTLATALGCVFEAPELIEIKCASGACAVSGSFTGPNRLHDVELACASSSAVVSFSGDMDMDDLTLTQGKLVSATCTPGSCASFKCGDLSISSLSECDLSSLPECTCTGSISNAGALRPPLLVRVTCTDGSCTLSGDLAGASKLHSLQLDCALQATDVQVACAMQLDGDLHLDKGGLSFSTCTPATCPYLECRDLTVAATGRVLGTGGKLPKLTSLGAISFGTGASFEAPELIELTCASGTCAVSGDFTGPNRLHNIELACASSSSTVSFSGDMDMDDLTLTKGKFVSSTCPTGSCPSFSCDDLSIAALGQLDVSTLPLLRCDGSFSNVGIFTCPPTTKFTCSSGACTLSGDMELSNAFSRVECDGPPTSTLTCTAPVTLSQLAVSTGSVSSAFKVNVTVPAGQPLPTGISVASGGSVDLSLATLQFSAASSNPQPCTLDDQSLSTSQSKYGDIVVDQYCALSLSSSKLYLYGGLQCDGSIDGASSELSFTGDTDVTISGSSSSVTLGKVAVVKAPNRDITCDVGEMVVSDLAISSGIFHCGTSELHILHSLTNDCTPACFDAGSGKLVMDGAECTVGGTSAVLAHDVTCANPVGITLTNDLTVSGTLTLTNGLVTTATRVCTCPAGASVVGGGPTTFINGKFKAGVELAGTVSKIFPVGTYDGVTKRYSPASVTLHDVSVAGSSLTLSATEAPASAFTGSGLSLARSVSTKFTALADASLAFSSCEMQFQWAASASTGTPALYRVAEFVAPSTWSSPPVLARTTNSISCTVSAFGDFLIGEPDCAAGLWTGAVSTEWSNPQNWCSGTVPDATTPVMITAVTNFFPIADNPVQISSLTISDNAMLTVMSTFDITGASGGTGAALDVSGELHIQPFGGAILVHGDMSLAVSGSVLSSGSLSVDGDLSLLGSFSGAAGSLHFTGSSLTDRVWTGSSTTTHDYGTIVYSRQARTGRNPQTGRCLMLSVSSGELDMGSADFEITGDLSITGGTLKAESCDISLSGHMQVDGTFDPGTGSMLFKGGGSKELTGTVSLLKFYDVVVQKTGGGVVTGNINVGNARMQAHTVSLSSGTLDAGTFTDIAVTGDWLVATGAIFTYGSCSVTFTGSDPAIIGGTSASVSLGKAINTKPLTGTANRVDELVVEDLVLNSGEFLLGTSTVRCTGSLLHTGGELVPETSSFVFSGSGTHNVSGQPLAFHNLQVDGDALVSVDPLTELSITGDFVIYGAKQGSTGKTKFTGDEEQLFTYSPVVGAPPSSFGDLEFENNSVAGVQITGDQTHEIQARTAQFKSGGITINAKTTALAAVSISAGCIVECDETIDVTLTVGGDFTNNGVFIPHHGTVVFNGSVAQSISGTAPLSFHNLTIDNAFGVSTCCIDTYCDGTVLLSNGKLTLTDHDMSLSSTGTVSGASPDRYIVTNGYVYFKNVITNNGNAPDTYVYPIGTASGYSPVSLSLSTTLSTNEPPVVFGARASDAAPSLSYTGETPSGAALLPRSVLKSFFIAGSRPTSSQLSVTVQWRAADEPPVSSGFSRQRCDLALFTGTEWSYAPASPASAGSAPNSFIVTRVFIPASATSNSLVLAVTGQQIACTVPASPYCAGQVIAVDYTASGGTFDGQTNVFQAELSDANGNFPGTIIGSSPVTAALSGTISCTIPASTSGTNYRIRVNSTAPASEGTDNGSALTISSSYTITASSTTNGTISPDGLTTLCSGASQSYTITADACYTIADVVVDGVSQGAVGTYTFTNVTANHTISASFIANPAPVFSPTSGTATTCAGSTIFLTGIAATGTSPVSYLWTGPGTIFNATSINASLGGTGTPGVLVHTLTATNGCGSATYTLTTTVLDPVPTVTANGPLSFCAGGSVTLTSSPGTFYQWNPGGQNTQSIVVTASGTYSVLTVANGCNASSAPVTVTVNPNYTITASAGSNGSITPNAITTLSCDGTGSQSYTITPDGGYAIADVIVDGVSQGAVGTFTFTNVATNHTISATFVNNATFTINSGAGANGSISPNGATVVNSGANQTYTMTPAACYHVLDVLVDGVSVGAVTSYTFTNVTANHTISATFAINAQLAITVSGPTNVCPYIGTGDQITYTATAPGATGYTWIIPPTNVTVISGQGTATLTVAFQNGFAAQANKQLRVTALSPCGNSPLFIYYLAVQIPSTPAQITGTTSVCSVIGTTATLSYTISSVPGAASYNWVAQAGTTTITHPNGIGVNDTTVNVSFTSGFTGSAITVSASNQGCGTSGTRSLALTKTNPSQPGLITGPTNACPYIAPGGTVATYSIVPVQGATSYTWTVPAGAIAISPQGTTSISFTFPNGFVSGTVSVTATSGCGTGNARSLSIGRLTPSTPGLIDVIQVASCPNRIYTYSLAVMPSNATSVQWVVPAGGTITNGHGTTSITVSYVSTVINGNVSAQGISNCGSSTIRSSTVKLPACAGSKPAIYSKSGKTNQEITAVTESLQVKLFPNPTVSDFKLQVLTTGNQPVNVRILDMQGREFKKFVVTPFQTANIGSDLKTGTYIIEVRQQQQVKIMKIIKF